MKTDLSRDNVSFSRTYRLTTKAEYAAVFDARLKVSQGWLLALYKKNQQPHPRIGLIVSKKIIKNATGRNRLKRILREAFRVRKSQLEGLDIVILARKGCNLANPVKLHKELDTIWQQLTACCHSASSTSSGCTATS